MKRRTSEGLTVILHWQPADAVSDGEPLQGCRKGWCWAEADSILGANRQKRRGTLARAQETAWDGRANNFDFLRLALAALVLYSHSYPLGGTPEALEPVMRLTHGQMTGGAVAVDLFFVMSGFLITASAERSRSLRSYFQKRVLRIYPGFLLLVCLTVLVALPLSGARWSEPGVAGRVGNVLLQTLRLREFDTTGAFARNPYPGSINGSVWSIQYEFWCYVGVAGLLTAGLLRRRGAVLAVFAAALVWGVLYQVRGWSVGGKFLGVLLGWPTLWARLLPLYLAGVVFYLFRGRIRLHWGLVAGAVAALAVACWVPFGMTAAFPLAGTYLVFFFAFTPLVWLHRFGRFGDFSYGTYLYAFPVQQVLIQAIGHAVAPWILFAAALPVTLLLAVASWYGVERRFLQPVRRKETVAHALEAA